MAPEEIAAEYPHLTWRKFTPRWLITMRIVTKWKPKWRQKKPNATELSGNIWRFDNPDAVT
jgi:hypothetical protein